MNKLELKYLRINNDDNLSLVEEVVTIPNSNNKTSTLTNNYSIVIENKLIPNN